jgi:RNA polymerase sigma-70 factor (ECF subfamily)
MAAHGTTATRADDRGLLGRAQQGDDSALEALFRRELPPLRRWARTRVPRHLWARADVDDFVQGTFIRALRRYRQFDVRTSATFQHYLRRILVNLVRDELRIVARQPERSELNDLAAPMTPSVVDQLIGKEVRSRYREALAQLPPRMRVALIARLERGASYDEIATLVDAPGGGAARALVGRGVTRLTAEMRTIAARRRQSRTTSQRTPDWRATRMNGRRRGER